MSWQRVPLFGSRMRGKLPRQVVEMRPRAPARHRAGGRRAARARRRAAARASSAADATARSVRPGWISAAGGGCGTRRRAKPRPPCRRTSSFRGPSPLRPQARLRWQVRPRFRSCETQCRSHLSPLRASQSEHRASRANSPRAGLISTSVTSVPGILPQRNATSAPTVPAPTMATGRPGPTPHPRRR